MGKEAGPRFKLITNVSEFGLFQSLAKSRLRLALSALVANGAFFGFTFWLADYITASSTSVGLNLFLIAASMLLLLASSYIEAMLLADLFFPGRYRERILLGKETPIDPNSGEALQVSNYKSYNLSFLIVVALVIVGNYFGMQALAGDYLDEYHHIGFHLTRLRSPDASDKIEALKEIAKPTYRELWADPRLTAAVGAELGADDKDVRQWAIWAAGEAEMVEFLPRLTAQLSHEDSGTEAEAALALGKMGDMRATPSLIDLLERSNNDKVATLGALRGLALLGDPQSGRAVASLLDAEDKEVRAHAYYAVGKVHHSAVHDLMLERLETGSPDDKCGALEALKYLVEPDDVRRFKDLFALTNHETSCDWVIFEDRDLEKTYIRFKESHRVKFIKIVWNGAGSKEKDWYAQIASDKEQPYDARLQATQLLETIKVRPGR